MIIFIYMSNINKIININRMYSLFFKKNILLGLQILFLFGEFAAVFRAISVGEDQRRPVATGSLS